MICRAPAARSNAVVLVVWKHAGYCSWTSSIGSSQGVGATVGEVVGPEVGLVVGRLVGRDVTGLSVGLSVGCGEGLEVVGGIVGANTHEVMSSPQGKIPFQR